MRVWILLAYKVPREPSASRVYVWRKLKRLGAIALQDAVWILPATPRTREHFQWLAAEIAELGGEASLWESKSLLDSQEETLVKQFESALTRSYNELLVKLERRRPDLVALSKRFQDLSSQDYFRSELGRKVRERLVAARGKVEP